jgi:hypothetical protein
MAQVDHAIDIFEGKTKGFAQGLFLFDNAPGHLKRGADAISARRMVKSEHFQPFNVSSLHIDTSNAIPYWRPKARVDPSSKWTTHA